MTASFEKFVVVQEPDDRRNCYVIYNRFTDGSKTSTGYCFDNYDAALVECAQRNQ